MILPDIDSRKDEYGYGLAYKLACEQLAGIKNIEEQCRRSDSTYRSTGSTGTILLEYLNRTCCVSFPDIAVSMKDSKSDITIRDKILILHYIAQAKGTPLTNMAITYKDLPEGMVYFRTFYKRAIQPIVTHFSEQPHRLLEVAGTLGGRKADCGDAAVTINPFSRVPLTFVLWKGDEELPATGNILFDRNIAGYLAIEDINVLCETVAWKCVKLLKNVG